MNAFPTDAHLHITVEPRLTRHLSQTIQTAELLELNAEGLYEYLAQAAEANPMMLVQRTPLPELPLHARCEGFDVGDFGMHDEQELGAYLRRQLAFLKLRKEKARIAAYLVESLDENGFFREDCASAARELGVSESAVKRCVGDGSVAGACRNRRSQLAGMPPVAAPASSPAQCAGRKNCRYALGAVSAQAARRYAGRFP